MARQAKKHDQVLKVLKQASGPMSANEVWEQLRAESSGIGLATVYRALGRGVEDGRLVAIELESGSVRYEPSALEHHHHFLCSMCRRAFDLKGCVRNLERLVPRGFRMANHEILLFGTCAECRRAG